MDTTKLGQVAAELMERLAEKMGEDDELGTIMVVAEINGKDSDSSWTQIASRCSDNRGWVQRGLLHAALRFTEEEIR